MFTKYLGWHFTLKIRKLPKNRRNIHESELKRCLMCNTYLRNHKFVLYLIDR